MRETEEITRYSANVIGQEGELFPITAERKTIHRYYSIQNLNSKVCIMDLFTVTSKIVTSGKDVFVIGALLDSTNKFNLFGVNIAQWCVKHSIDQSNFYKLLSRALREDLICKKERGVYMVNPFLFKAKGASNEDIENSQRIWIEVKEKSRVIAEN
jgi:hypothetical protein